MANLRLSPRQVQVLQLVAEGMTNQEIADHLNISKHTAADHVSLILVNLGCHTRSGAVYIGLKAGLID